MKVPWISRGEYHNLRIVCALLSLHSGENHSSELNEVVQQCNLHIPPYEESVLSAGNETIKFVPKFSLLSTSNLPRN